MKQFVPLLLFVMMFFANTQAQTTYYVSATNGSDSNDGTSTSTPFEDIKTAVSAATSGDKILLTAETYTINGVITVNEDITITGGYNATFSEQTGYTTLDGNSVKRIIDFIGVADSVTFDHFIIQNGYRYNGGGMYLEESDLSLTNIIFYNNTANGERGGAVYMDKSNPALTNVAFIGNSSKLNGGAMYLDESCPTLTNATFYNNDASNTAGAIYLIGASIPLIQNSVFYNNTAESTSYEDIDSYKWENCYVSLSSSNNASTASNSSDDNTAGSTRFGDDATYVKLSSDPFANSSDPDGNDNTFGTKDDGLIPENFLMEKGNNSYNSLTYDLTGNYRKIKTIDIGAYEREAVYYVVNGLETGNHNGSNWDNAFDDLNYAITNFGIEGSIFRVAANTTDNPFYIETTINITNGIEIYGGYDITSNKQAGYSIVDGGKTNRVFNNKENVSSTVVFDHLIIQNGYAEKGGGLYNYKSPVKLTNVIFKDNAATSDGGGMYDYQSSVELTNVIFRDNTATEYGGGMHMNESSSVLTNIKFIGNEAEQCGGGISEYKSSSVLKDVAFIGNSAEGAGGGMYNNLNRSILTNVVFSGNNANSGGGMANYVSSSPTLINVIFSKNVASVGGGGILNDHSSPTVINATFIKNYSFRGGGIRNNESSLILYNSVFYANSAYFSTIADVSNLYSSTTSIYNASNHSSGGLQDTDGFILLTSDPFTNSGTPEGDDGEWATSDDGLVPVESSQLINTGDKSYNSTDTDILGAQRVQKDRIDIGAYESEFYPATSTFTGTGSWGTDVRWSAGMVDDGGTAIIDGTCNITATDRTVDDLVINDSASLTLYPGVVFIANNTITNNAGTSGLVIQSDASGSAQLMNNTAGVTVTVEQYLTGSAWHLVSSPALGETISDFLSSNSNIPTSGSYRGMMDYNETNNNWNTFFTDAESGSLTAGKGFSLRTDNDSTVTYTGTLAPGTVNLTVARTGSYGWNCVGNPYPSAIFINNAADATNNFIDLNTDNLDDSYGAIYVWEQSNSAYTIIALDDADAFYAQVGQGFFVKVKTGGTQVQFTTAMQTHQPGAAFKSGTVATPELTLAATLGEESRTARIKFNDETTTGLDFGRDAGVFKTGFDIYTRLIEDNGVDFGVQSLPETGIEEYVIPVGIDATASGEITIRLKSENLKEGIVPVLNDQETGMSFPFNSEEDVYSTSISESTGYGRFTLTFSSTTDVDDILSGEPHFRAWYSNGSIYISGEMDGTGEATVYDINGRKVAIHQLSNSVRNQIDAPTGASSLYLVRISDSKRSEVLKVPVVGR